MRFLSLEEALETHTRVIAESPPGISAHAGVRTRGGLEAALERARWGPFEVGDLAERAALLLRGVAQDHPFEDGNKRTAFALAWVFLDLNGAALKATDEEIVSFMLGVARGELDLDAITGWLRAHMENL